MKRCSDCGIEKPLECFHKYKTTKDGYNGICKECNNERARKWRQNNKIKISKRRHKSYIKNREEILKHAREYRRLHRKRLLKKRREWYKLHKKETLESARKYKSTINGKVAKMRAQHKRRAYQKDTKSNLTTKQWNKVLKMQNNRCNICNKKFTEKRIPTIDHIIPLSSNGDLIFENVQALCSSCNSKKCAKLDLQFIQTWLN